MTKFATAINCMSGRVQLPVMTYIKNTQGVDYVDMITAPGVNKLLAEGIYLTTTELIKKSAEISVDGHGSRLIAIVGHHDCSGNPADKEVQRKQTLAAVRIVNSWALNTRVVGLWVDENWKVSEVNSEANDPSRASHSLTEDSPMDKWGIHREG